jgi:hypothetical protein
MIDSFNPQHFNVIASAMVDDELWYQIRVYSAPCKAAIRSHKNTMWYEYGLQTAIPLKGSLFDIHSKLFTILAIEFSST